MADGSLQVHKWPITTWWEKRTAPEKVGVAAISAGILVVGAVALAPEMAAAAAGGALTATGAWLLRKGFRA